jgi:hypothetical protein
VVTNISEKPTAAIFRVENGGSRFLLNFGNLLPDYMVSYPRRPQSKTPVPVKTSNIIFHTLLSEGNNTAVKWSSNIQLYFSFFGKHFTERGGESHKSSGIFFWDIY